MDFRKLTDDLNIISALGDNPNADNALTPSGLKAKFDEAALKIKHFLTIPPQKPRHFFAYLAKICRNYALKKLDWKSASKRSAEVVSLTQEMETCIPDAARDRELESRELGQILDAFLRTLSEENQMVFLRRYWYVDTIAEIAVRYGISESAVQMRLNRTRSKLAAYLAKEGIKV